MILSAFWSLAEQPPLLGNFLAFRQELEMLSQMRGASEVHLYLEPNGCHGKFPKYAEEALLSKVPIRVCPSSLLEEYDWPPKDAEVRKWAYGSLRRISILHQISKITPILSWPIYIEEEAEAIYRQIKRCSDDKVFAIHLKQQGDKIEESNASLSFWEIFFKSHPEIKFVLLGNDLLPERFFSLPNLFFAEKQLGMRLAVQLAFCKKVDAFLGMASGICTAAICSQTPYVIFKHPLHHPEEMEQELGRAESFTFAGQNQKLWRKLDSFENINSTLNVVNNRDENVVWQK